MLEPMEKLPAGVLGFRSNGQITASDYTDVLKPAIDAVVQRDEEIRIVIEFGDWSGMSGGALWEDLKMGIERFTKWKKIALVTDVDWMRHLTKAFSWLAPKGMKVFSTSDLDAAKAWAAG